MQRAGYKYPNLVLEEKEEKGRSVSEGLHTSSHLLQWCTKPKAVCVARRRSSFSILVGIEEKVALKHTNLSSKC